jgi:hypothetical protein
MAAVLGQLRQVTGSKTILIQKRLIHLEFAINLHVESLYVQGFHVYAAL